MGSIRSGGDGRIGHWSADFWEENLAASAMGHGGGGLGLWSGMELKVTACRHFNKREGFIGNVAGGIPALPVTCSAKKSKDLEILKFFDVFCGNQPRPPINVINILRYIYKQ
jgi:hypothetical protein